MSLRTDDRFSGHESFVFRYGWLPKVFRAVRADSRLLRDDARATHALGIGRNMVKSIQFWGEATGVIRSDGHGGHIPGPVGSLLLGEAGWDPHLASLESMWLLHWWLVAEANLAAWREVFGDGQLQRFDRRQLADALARRGHGSARALAVSTLEQHAGIFLQTYLHSERNADDTSWCPLQDLGLLRTVPGDNGRPVYTTDAVSPMGLSDRVFAIALVRYVERVEGRQVVSFRDVLRGDYGPGAAFGLSEAQLRQFIEVALAGALSGALRFNDTADTQTLVLTPAKVKSELRLTTVQEALAHA
jgi:hypothetical protein